MMVRMATRPATIEFWFDFASTYSHLAALRIEGATAGLRLVYRPFLLGPIFAEQGLRDSPFNANPVRGRHMWRDVAREADKYGLPFRKPSVFPRNSVPAARIASAALGEPWLPAFVRAVFCANFVDDRDIDERPVLSDCLGEHGRFLEARGPLREATEEARRRGVFGAPTFFVVGGGPEELYFGNDRLDDAVALARTRT